MQPKHVLAAPFPGGHITETSVASQDLTLFKMNVNRMIPAPAAIDQGPNLASASLRSSRNLVLIGGETLAAIGSDGPGCVIRTVGAAEFEGAFPSYGNLRQIGIRNQRARHLTVIGFRAGDDPELEKLTDA